MKRTSKLICFLLSLAALALTGCKAEHSEVPGPIVQTAQNAGAGDLSGISTQAMEQWLGKHRDVSDRIEAMCKPVRQNASAGWGDSTEGRLCTAAHDLAFFRSGPVTGDGKTFRPGTH